MAKKQPSREEELAALVKIQRQGRAFGAGLPVNPGFRPPNVVDRARGVAVDDPEQGEAEQAVAARVLAELQPANLRLWIFDQADRRGGARVGMARLRDDLLKVKPVPAGKDEQLYGKALKRSLERSGPARKPGRKEQHQTIKQPDYRERIALLMLQEAQVVLGVVGRWAIVWEGGREERFGPFWTDPSIPEELEEARRIVAMGGIGLVRYVWKINDDKTVGSAVLILERLHGVQVQIDTGRV